MENFKWNLDSIAYINGVSYTITLPQNYSGYVYYVDQTPILENIDRQVDSMSEFPLVKKLLNKVK